jgi:hypothetical protein
MKLRGADYLILDRTTVEKTRIEVTQYHQTKEEFKIFLILALIALALEMFLRTRD